MYKRIDEAIQICSCKNVPEEEFKGRVIKPEEHYGFTKARMWDQYADSYRGVCIAFSKKELLKLHNGLSGDVEYIRYDDLHVNGMSIRLNSLVEMGYEAYSESINQRLNQVGQFEILSESWGFFCIPSVTLTTTTVTQHRNST